MSVSNNDLASFEGQLASVDAKLSGPSEFKTQSTKSKGVSTVEDCYNRLLTDHTALDKQHEAGNDIIRDFKDLLDAHYDELPALYVAQVLDLLDRTACLMSENLTTLEDIDTHLCPLADVTATCCSILSLVNDVY